MFRRSRPDPETMQRLRRVGAPSKPGFRWLNHSADPREVLKELGPDTRVALLSEPEVLTPALRARGVIAPTEYAEIARMRAASFFLVRNDGSSGERLRCMRCNRLHAHFTWFCCEQPFRGLRDALRAYVKVGTSEGHSFPRARALLAAVPELGDSHPETARLLKPGEAGEDLYGVALGIAEPISEVTARRYESIIRGRDRTFRI